MGFDKEILRGIAKSAGLLVDQSVPANAVLLDDDTTQGTIGDNFVRHVYRLSLSNDNNSPVKITIYRGDSVDRDRNKLGAWLIPAYSTLIVGEDIETPLFMVRPNTGVSPTQGNRLYALIVANDMEVVLDYYDETQ